jgi:membrane-associated protease RseP (regulator of RpoE activity)
MPRGGAVRAGCARVHRAARAGPPAARQKVQREGQPVLRGFGKTLWSTKRGETEYGIKAIPLGGFVRLVGMFPPAKDQAPGTVRPSTTGMFRALVDNARAAEYQHIQPEDEPRLFYRKKWWQKLIIMSGGPLVNVALAVLILGGVFMGIG